MTADCPTLLAGARREPQNWLKRMKSNRGRTKKTHHLQKLFRIRPQHLVKMKNTPSYDPPEQALELGRSKTSERETVRFQAFLFRGAAFAEIKDADCTIRDNDVNARFKTPHKLSLPVQPKRQRPLQDRLQSPNWIGHPRSQRRSGSAARRRENTKGREPHLPRAGQYLVQIALWDGGWGDAQASAIPVSITNARYHLGRVRREIQPPIPQIDLPRSPRAYSA